MIRLRFKELLEERGVTPHAVHRMSSLARNTVYALVKPRKAGQRVDLDTLEQAMAAVARLTGNPVHLADVLEQVDDLMSDVPTRAEEERWLEAAAQDLAQELRELEADVSPEDLRDWLNAFERAAR